MGKLLLYHESNTRRQLEFNDQLSKQGIVLENWSLKSTENVKFLSSASALAMYEDEVERVKSQYGFENADFLSVNQRGNSQISLRYQHLSEHVHDEDEVRFFTYGDVLVFVNVNGLIHALHCIAGDFLVIPRGIKHWLDIGPSPNYQCILWYNSASKLAIRSTGSCVAESTPRWEAILGA